jgi:exosortase
MHTTAQIFENMWTLRARVLWSSLLIGLLLLLYGSLLKALLTQWWTDPDYSHGFLVPVFSFAILWKQRLRWQKAEIQPSNVGLVVMLGGVMLLFAGSLGAELFVSRVSLLVVLAGIILYLFGWNLLRAVSFPLCFLLLMIPIPAIIFNQITFPLQLIASRFAAVGLDSIHIPILREGNVLVLPNYSLEVVEACSGIRSLMSLISLAIAYLYLVEPRYWVRYTIVIVMVPIAIVTNAIRISGAGVLAYHIGPAAAEGFLHGFSDWMMFMVAFVLMFLCHSALRNIGKLGRETVDV